MKSSPMEALFVLTSYPAEREEKKQSTHSNMIEFTLLYFDGCPSWISALENLKKVIEVEQIPADITLLRIDDSEQAQREHFLGSPSIHVNGVDLWPEERVNYTLNCRVYKTPTGLKGSPTIEMLSERLHKLA